MILLKQMMIFGIMMAAGYVMARKNILDEKSAKAISWLIVNIANPALILSGCIGNTISKSELLSVLTAAVVLYVILIILAELFVPFFRFRTNETAVYKLLFAFSNIGFMGFPIISALCGTKALLYASVFLLPFNFLIYTYGIFCLTGKAMHLKTILKECVNPGVTAVLLTFVFALYKVELPYVINQSIIMLSNLSAPLCMMVVGAAFVSISWKETVCDLKLLVFSAIRLLVIPYIIMQIVFRITEDTMMQTVIFVVMATPAGSMVSMLAQQYDKEYLTASKVIAVTTVLSVVTMPVLSGLLKI